ncbi:MAG: hypothetical protein EXQ70_03265 [Solirubrobacterales bacterium]|nr:hypothetical protein [Solirubrobacterales bacterium]
MSNPGGEQDPLRLPAWALPLIVVAVCVTIVLGFLLQGPALGLAAGAALVAALLVAAARLTPRIGIEVAPAQPGGPRVVVLATGEIDGDAAERIARQAAGAEDVRILMPAPSGRLSRWLSAEDDARDTAQRWLAHSAGTLTAAGLAVSGSVGDSDVVQALEDELRDYPADQVIVCGEGDRARRATSRIADRLELPVVQIS